MVYAKWYLLLLDLKKWHRYAITVLLIAVLLLMWVFFVYLPLYKQTMIIRMQLNQGRQDLQTNVSERALCKELSQEIEQLKHATQGISSASLKKIEENIGLVTREMENLSMRLLSIKKIGQAEKEQHGATLVSMQAEGSLVAIMQFFTMLKNNRLLVQCSHFTVQHERDDLYMLHAVLKFFNLKKIGQNESPSTLEKS